MINAILFSFLGTIFGTFLGGLFAYFFKKINKEVTSFLTCFSVGSLLSLTLIDLFPEAIELLNETIDNELISTLYVLIIVTITGLLFYFLHECLHILTHHHDKDHSDEEACKDHAHSVEIFNEKSFAFASFIFLIAISIHNIPEGLTLGISFSKEVNNFPLNGVLTSCILLIHNFIIGFTLFNSFYNHQKNTYFSFAMTIVSSIPAFIFALIGYFITTFTINDIYSSILFAISAGSLLYVIFIEMVPSAFKEYKSKFTFIYILVGLVTFTFLLAIGGH